MKKLIGIGIAAMMVMGLAGAANAGYIIKATSQNDAAGAGAFTLTLKTDGTSGYTPCVPAQGAEATVAVFMNNDPTLDPLSTSTVNIAYSAQVQPDPVAWYGVCLARAGYTGAFDTRFYCTTSSSKATTGTWYLYKGIGTVTAENKIKGATLVDDGVFAYNGTTPTTSWASSALAYTFASGDKWTLSQLAPDAVPEPGSMLAMFSGLVGLAGYGIRRRK